jgi:hypothetical protein
MTNFRNASRRWYSTERGLMNSSGRGRVSGARSPAPTWWRPWVRSPSSRRASAASVLPLRDTASTSSISAQPQRPRSACSARMTALPPLESPRQRCSSRSAPVPWPPGLAGRRGVHQARAAGRLGDRGRLLHQRRRRGEPSGVHMDAGAAGRSDRYDSHGRVQSAGRRRPVRGMPPSVHVAACGRTGGPTGHRAPRLGIQRGICPTRPGPDPSRIEP